MKKSLCPILGVVIAIASILAIAKSAEALENSQETASLEEIAFSNI